jgi:hypothetical protein
MSNAVSKAERMRREWVAIEQIWTETMARAIRLPESSLARRVNDQWSFLETLRHLVFVTDAWVRRAILSDRQPWHPCALPPDDDVDVRPWGINRDDVPTIAEVIAARRDRQEIVRRVMDALTDESLSRMCTPPDAVGWPPPTPFEVGFCLDLVLSEERAHHSYATRDLALIEAAL